MVARVHAGAGEGGRRAPIISVPDPLLPIWDDLAKQYQSQHSEVTFDIQQIEAGLVKDITADLRSWRDTIVPTSFEAYEFDGKTYAVPYDVGMVGFWYNKTLFAKANITTPPATWAELLDAVRALKSSGVTPIALTGGAKWPGHYYWTYLAMRVAGSTGSRKPRPTGLQR